MVRRWWVAVLALGLAQAWAAPGDPFPDMARAYWVERDGQVLWQRAADTPLPMASLTKLLTLLLVVESGVRGDRPVTITHGAAAETGTRLRLQAGERYAAQDLLAAAMLMSANDACRALADAVEPRAPRFAQRLNQRARALGLRHSHFDNACGHHARTHQATVRDLALLAHAVLRVPELAELARTGEASFQSLDGRHRHTVHNSNALIGRYPGAVGLKTGYTPQAGPCLIAVAERGGHQVMLVLLHARDRWWNATDVMDLAFVHALGT